MSKLDTTTGLSAKQIGVIKYKLKNAIDQLLPLLPDSIEMKVFFEGRSAWIYIWRLLDQGPIDLGHPISVEVLVKLKKEFMKFHLRFIKNNENPKIPIENHENHENQ